MQLAPFCAFEAIEMCLIVSVSEKAARNLYNVDTAARGLYIASVFPSVSNGRKTTDVPVTAVPAVEAGAMM